MVDIICGAICCRYDHDAHGGILEELEDYGREQGCGRLHDDVVLLFCCHSYDVNVVWMFVDVLGSKGARCGIRMH